jgi:dTDP-glucose 4,6-dehydratase
MTKTVLLLGSNSFAGSNFTDYLLSKKMKVIGISRSKEINSIFLKYKRNKYYKKNFSFYQIDLNKNVEKIISLIKKNKIKFIVNFSSLGMVAESWLKPWDWYNTNVVSFSKLIHHLKDLNITKFLNFSTPEVYGDTRKLIKENNFFKPTTPYAISRAAQDLNLKAYHKSFNFPVVFTRTANIFGPYQQLYRIVPIVIIKSLKKEKLFLHGSGKSIRSFIFMDDVSELLYKILKDKNNIGETFHISTKKFIKIKNLVNLILKLQGKKNNLVKNVPDRVGKDYGYFLNSSKANIRYSYRNKTSLEEGIKQTINWVEDNFRKINKLNLKYTHKK